MKFTSFIALVAIGAIGLVGVDRYQAHARAQADAVPVVAPKSRIVEDAQVAAPVEDRSWIKPRDNAPAIASAAPASSASRCDGRTHCSQMRSCEEATYFLQHCPNTQMDGDRDGVACERQWC
ncbi:excalibur calcium-binding domain-containing protein [Thermomonas sp.]|uniref:excalibur calcium-binding domain-containing protein n=1 Tax=Thermomonas sp. TaxID=1971895 RepID=UPI0035B4A990